MTLLFGVSFLLISVSPFSSLASLYPGCPNLKEDRINELKKLKVSGDVHDMLVGDFSEVWGPKEVVDPGQNTCITFRRQKSDDKTLLQTMTAEGEWFGGKRLINLTLERVDNGVYLATNKGVVKAVFFILYVQNNVITHYAWEACSRDLDAPPPPDSKRRYVTFVTGVSVRTQDLVTPLRPDTQAAVDEAVRIIQGHKDLLGDIVPLSKNASFGRHGFYSKLESVLKCSALLFILYITYDVQRAAVLG